MSIFSKIFTANPNASDPAMPTVLNRAQHVLRPTTYTIAKTTIPSVVNTGRRGLAGTIALGVAAG